MIGSHSLQLAWAPLAVSWHSKGDTAKHVMLLHLQMSKVREAVKGEAVPLASLPDFTDARTIQKVSHVLLQFSESRWKRNVKLCGNPRREYITCLTHTDMWPQMHRVSAQELQIGSLADAVACRMGARDA